jgi:hypothetical protein
VSIFACYTSSNSWGRVSLCRSRNLIDFSHASNSEGERQQFLGTVDLFFPLYLTASSEKSSVYDILTVAKRNSSLKLSFAPTENIVRQDSMKDTAAKNALKEFFEIEDTASGYIARCPDCKVRFAVNVKKDVVPDDYLKLLLEHAKTEKIIFETDEEIRGWLSRSKSQTESLLTLLEQAAGKAEPQEYKFLRPALLDLKALSGGASQPSIARPRGGVK